MPVRRRTDPGTGRDPEPLDDLPIAVLVLDGGRVALVNGEWTELTGRTLAESVGEQWLDALHADDRDAARTLAQRSVDRDIEGHDWRLRTTAGTADLWVHARVRHLPDVAAGRCVITITEIDDRKTNELRLLHLATHDTTTGLPNREVFEHRLASAMADATATTVTAVLFIDLDRFKEVNDQLGHRVGDLVLVAVAGRIEGTLRPSDLVARLGGDEFAVVCTDLGGAVEATALAGRIAEVLRAPFVLDDHVVQMSASVGVAWVTGHDAPLTPLVDAADQAMYRAKAEGGAHWSAHDGSTGDIVPRDDPLASALQLLHTHIRRAEADTVDLLDATDGSEDSSNTLARVRVLLRRARTLLEETIEVTGSTAGV